MAYLNDDQEGMPLLVLCTIDDGRRADELASLLVERNLAACVNLLGGITSVYLWQGKRERAQEILMLIKTTDERYDELEETLLDAHPYELPEIVAVPITDGLPAYLSWINNTVKIP